MRLISIAALLLLCAGAAFAQGGPCYVHTGPWTKVWTFDSGTEGWSLSSGAMWVNWGVGGRPGGMIYAPDAQYADYDTFADPILAQRLKGFGSGNNFFVLQCDVFVAEDNRLQGNGLQVRREGDAKGPWGIGNAASSQGMVGNDRSWYNTHRHRSWGLAKGAWTTIQIDYGYSKPGYFTVGYLATQTWPGQWAWCIDYTHNAPVHPNQIFRWLRIGGSAEGSPVGSWAQAYYDEVRIFVPEPGSMLALGTGLVGLFGLIRRRK